MKNTGLRLLIAVTLLLRLQLSGIGEDIMLEERISALIARMTWEEKISLLGGDRGFYLRGIPRLHIPEVRMADGPMGIKDMGKATAFPASVCMAASFNTALIREVGAAIGRECRAKGVGILLAPGVNICRIPQNGRNFEYYGEDPFLAGQIAVAFIKGVQSRGVWATVKHLAGNSLEYDRHRTDSQIDERTLHEIYLPAFRAAVREGGCRALMTAYNQLNGVHCSEHMELIRDIVKRDWGFSGIVMSDWLSVYSPRVIEAGLDLEMPKADFMTGGNVRAAVAAGKIGQADLDDKVRRLLRISLSAFPASDKAPDLSDAEWRAHARIALQAAQEGIVLLKNERDTLPLEAKRLKKIVLLGPNASSTPTSGGGAARVDPYCRDNILDGIRQRSGQKIDVLYAPFIPDGGEKAGIDGPLAGRIRNCDVAIVCAGFDERIEGEGHDRPFELPKNQVQLIRKVQELNLCTVVVISAGGAVAMESWLDRVPAVIQSWYLGQVSGAALAGILFGDVNPSGKLPISLPRRWEDASAFGAYDVAKSLANQPPLFTLHGKPHDSIPVPYREGLRVGYRHFDRKGIVPAFPFGHGLSYTRFMLSEMRLVCENDCTYRVEVKVSNIGERSGQEVVQVYIHPKGRPDRPENELKGFAKVFLRPGEARSVSIPLNRESFASYDPDLHSWRVTPGDYCARVGTSSRSIWLQDTIHIGQTQTFR